MLTSRLKIQLAIFAVIALIAGGIMVFGYIRVPAIVGLSHYTVTVQLPNASGLYASGNVTYRGTEVGRVTDVKLTEQGVDAVLLLKSGIDISSDLIAEVHSVSAIGEQYVALTPRADGPPLKNGDVIPVDRTTVPPPINALLDAANRGIQAIPRDEVKTVVDESYTAIGGLGPELLRIVQGSTRLATDARKNLDPLITLIDRSGPILDSQTETADSVQAWAAHLADLSDQVKTQDAALTGLLEHGPAAADEGRRLIERVKPTLPILLANLVDVGETAVVYQPAIEQLLVLQPQNVAAMQAAMYPNKDVKKPFGGMWVNFNLNLNIPSPCTTGYLPPQQLTTPDVLDAPERAPGDLYCRIPQDSSNAVRGARNYPCLTRPGKRAPTVKMCESDEEYVPLNDGYNWKGDPNATLTGQDVPQLPPGTPAETAAPPLAVAQYDPATGSYLAPDGRVYTQADLAPSGEGKTWQSMLTPPK